MSQNRRKHSKSANTSILLTLMLSLGLLMPTFADGTSVENVAVQTAAPQNVVRMITDTGGLGDQAFNDSAFKGLERYKTLTGNEIKVSESQTADDYLTSLEDSVDAGDRLTIGIGFLFNNAMTQVSSKAPKHHFAVIDSVVDQPNVASVVFKEEEGSYLAGVAAGLATKTNKVGFVAGINMPLIQRFEYGFRAGVLSVNPRAKVMFSEANSFSDKQIGAKIAADMHKKGVDVIYTAAGAVAIGVAETAEQENFWFIGTDVDQSALAPKNTLCSMVKNLDVATYALAMQTKTGKFSGGVQMFGLKENGVSLSDNGKHLTADAHRIINLFKKAVVEGKIKVPTDAKSMKAFKKPNISFKRPARVTQ